MPDKKQEAYEKAIELRDREYKRYDRALKKYNDLYAEWQALVAGGDSAKARAKFDELMEQSKLVDRSSVPVTGKLDAITALQNAKTLADSDKAIDALIKEEIDELFAILADLIPGIFEAIFKKKFPAVEKRLDGFEKAYLLLLEIKGKQKIEEIVDKLK